MGGTSAAAAMPSIVFSSIVAESCTAILVSCSMKARKAGVTVEPGTWGSRMVGRGVKVFTQDNALANLFGIELKNDFKKSTSIWTCDKLF
jgi:hypothetical protein